MDNLVSVIIPVYKVKEEYLHKCIDSVIAQTYNNIEILLIDDGSPDNCGRICDEYANHDNRIKVFHKANGGVSYARNVGLDNATGEYIMFVDSDDWLEVKAVETLVNYQIQNKADLIACGYFKGNNLVEKKTCSVTNLSGAEVPKAIAGKYNYVMGYLWNKLFLKSIIDAGHIRFDETSAVCEDSLFCQEYAVNCHNVICIKPAMYHYRINIESATHSKFSLKNATVFQTYRNIIDLCNEYYKDNDLDELLNANYFSHYIQSLYRIKCELDFDERIKFKYVYKFVKANLIYILKNKYLKVKRKFLAVYLTISMAKSFRGKCDQ